MKEGFNQEQSQTQSQLQRQVQRMSQRQIQAVSYLAMSATDLRNEILKAASENPALEIVKDPLSSSYDNDYSGNYHRKNQNSVDADSYQKILENNEAHSETLQQHLMSQLNSTKLSPDEYNLCRSLIYNLDKNGCYGSMLNPEALLDKSRPSQNKMMLERCIDRIQRMDPVGTCCKSIEESLFVQAKISEKASELTLFILDGHLELLNPPQVPRVLNNLKRYQEKWHEKAFAKKIILDEIELSEENVEKSIKFILSLNPHPCGEYISDISSEEFMQPDVILSVTRQNGYISTDDFSSGKIVCDDKSYFQVKYASGDLPELRLAKDYSFDKNNIENAKIFLSLLEYRESSIVLQGCAIVSMQKEFFQKGPNYLKPLTRKQVSQMIGVHQSTVSRMSSKKGSKYIQTEFGLYPASFFFTSGVDSSDGSEKVSSAVIKNKIEKILEENNQKSEKKLSDSKIAELLNSQGINISRRTVAKYRSQTGIRNSYSR